ncbi:MAG: NADH-quinone oxidoreductase subunit D [candidate division Zixibacteria bacterium 4484_95]|nr:MAG: NADH-quinone oxidoreductase subunit D [candidate division Zixibacteria bacterium 4484_95]
MSYKTITLNVGPQHPATHGVLRVKIELDGETIVSAKPIIGYLHSGIEKNMEVKTYTQAITMTDRMDYLAPMSNNLVYVMAVEKLMDVEVPPRAQYIRVILTELTRLNSHLVWLGTHATDIGAMTMLLYCFREREKITQMYEFVSGVRMMSSYFRIGGLDNDVPPGFDVRIKDILDTFPAKIEEYEGLLTENKIWKNRTIGVGKISAEEAIKSGLSGPLLRASGVNWDIRKSNPYSSYDHFEFDVPLGENGDTYDRYKCRLEEMRQSLRIIRQALDGLPSGPYITKDRKITPPPKEEALKGMEQLIHHFKFWTEGFKPPKGDVYHSIESPKGEIGCYIVSDGTNKPYRVHFRPPSFVNISALDKLARGQMVSDLIAIIGSVDIVLGEVDR